QRRDSLRWSDVLLRPRVPAPGNEIGDGDEPRLGHDMAHERRRLRLDSGDGAGRNAADGVETDAVAGRGERPCGGDDSQLLHAGAVGRWALGAGPSAVLAL